MEPPKTTPKTRSDRRGIADLAAIVIATGAGAGFSPKAPGTCGALLGVVIYLLMDGLEAGSYYLHVIIFFLVVGTWAAHRVQVFWGHDSQRIVIDEVVGQMITFGLAAGSYRLSALYIAIGFGLFRLFDIAKPFPLRRLEEIHGGLGVIIDDVGAGIYALMLLSLIQYLFGA
jgi:phosphatidylglycerophosphatase A